MRHKALVALIDWVFVPVFILNSNGPAHDQAVLKEFKEPAWNYPVARFLSAERKDLVPRLPDVWKSKTPVVLVATRMLEAIEAGKFAIADEALAILKDLKDAKSIDGERVAEMIESLDGKLGREVHKALAPAAKAYEKRDFAKAREAAAKIQADESSEEEAKTDALWVVAKIDGKFRALQEKAAALKAGREYLLLFEIVDKQGKSFAGLPSPSGEKGQDAEAWLSELKELRKDKDVRAEVKLLEDLAKLEEKLAETKDEKAKAALLKKLEALIEKAPESKAAEKAKALIG